MSENREVRLAIAKPAAKALVRMQPKRAAAILAALKAIAADPFAPHPNVTALAGTKDACRLRHGGWRIVYEVDRKGQTMTVQWIGPRGDAYR